MRQHIYIYIYQCIDSTCRIKAKHDILKQMSNISTYIVAHSIDIRVANAKLNTLSTNKRLHAAIAKVMHKQKNKWLNKK